MDLDLSLLGWAHSAACACALALGLAAFLQRKGSAPHIALGRGYLVAMLVVNATAFGIYRRHMFWFPHWFAVTALACLAIAYAAVRLKLPSRGWVHLHLTGMLASYYVLVGGGVNEVYLRVDALRAIVVATGGAVVGATHMIVIGVFIGLIVAANLVAARGGRPNASPALARA
jgi:uncharacterized membrane protein